MPALCRGATHARSPDAILELMDDPQQRAQLARRRKSDRAAVRHHRVRQENGTALRAADERLARRSVVSRRARSGAPAPAAKTLSRIAVVTSTPWFVEGGHLVMARSLVQALREEGHEAELVLTPQNRFGRQGAAYLAAWLTDVGSGAQQSADRSGHLAAVSGDTPSATRITSSG